MKTYLSMLQRIIDHGVYRDDRTGTGTWSVFGEQARFSLHDGFPLLTTKKLHLRSIIHELLWFLKGDTNVKYLKDNKVSIWDEWADDNGDLGRVYGAQWTDWKKSDGSGSINQIEEVIRTIRQNPDSRDIWSVPGTQVNCTLWHFLHAMHCSNSMWPMVNLVASFINEVPTFFWVFLLISHPMRS